MFELLMIPLMSLYLIAITWLFYLALMNLRINKDKLTLPAKVLAYPMLGIGLVLDITLNMVVGTLAFASVPKEWLFTTRCERYLKSKTWRGGLARWFCRNFLDPFDKNGKHCRG